MKLYCIRINIIFCRFSFNVMRHFIYSLRHYFRMAECSKRKSSYWNAKHNSFKTALYLKRKSRKASREDKLWTPKDVQNDRFKEQAATEVSITPGYKTNVSKKTEHGAGMVKDEIAKGLRKKKVSRWLNRKRKKIRQSNHNDAIFR